MAGPEAAHKSTDVAKVNTALMQFRTEHSSALQAGGAAQDIRRFFVEHSLTKQRKVIQPMSTTYDLLKVISRRPVGKGAWRMTLTELIESERTCLQYLRAIGNRHPSDGDLQRFVAQATAEAAERIAKLNELLCYKGESAEPPLGFGPGLNGGG